MSESTDQVVASASTLIDSSGVPDAPLLLAPADGMPALTTTAAELDQVIASFAAASGPVALDAERASGYRYSQRAYLVQLRRDGAGTALIDPTGCHDLSALGRSLADAEWVLHAANQDLACLAEIGMVPTRLFDTELAARLLGYPRVALGTMIEQLLGVRLEKGHSAADWSTRPLPAPWLTYAALDVELLLPLREALANLLTDAGKLDWADQEFTAVLEHARQEPVPRAEPWRRLSGIHRLRRPRQLASARALWGARDTLAADMDVAPGRLLPDSAIIAAVASAPGSESELRTLPVFSGPRQRSRSRLWWSALASATQLPENELPRMTGSSSPDALPQASKWAERDPAAAERLARVRAALKQLAETQNVPVENLLEPALSRRVAWDAPADLEMALAAGGARPWQIQLTTGPLEGAITAAGAAHTDLADDADDAESEAH